MLMMFSRSLSLIYTLVFLCPYMHLFSDNSPSPSAINLELENKHDHPLKINIFSNANGKGLEKSRQILKHALMELGHDRLRKIFPCKTKG